MDGPQSLQDWIRYLHTAASVPRGHADYAEAQSAVNYALGRIQHLNRSENATDRAQADQPGAQTNPGASFIGNAADFASLGLGEPLAGLGSAISGKGFGAGAEAYREGLGNLEAANPRSAYAGKLAGLVLPALVPGSQTVQATRSVRAGIPLGMGQIASRLGRGALAGGGIGAVAGFSHGGEDPGDLAARGRAAEVGGAMGAVLGAGTTGAGMFLGRHHAERIADLVNKGEQRALTAGRRKAVELQIQRAERGGATSLPEGVTAEEAAVAKKLGLPVEMVRGRVGQAAISHPTPKPPTIRAALAERQARRPFMEPRLTERTPRDPFVAPTVKLGGRYTRAFTARGASQQFSPAQEQALEGLVAGRIAPQSATIEAQAAQLPEVAGVNRPISVADLETAARVQRHAPKARFAKIQDFLKQRTEARAPSGGAPTSIRDQAIQNLRERASQGDADAIRWLKQLGLEP